MNYTKSTQENLDIQLQANKLIIILEIVIVFLPFILGIIIGDNIGTGHISLGSNLVIIGNPITYLGLIISLLFLWGASRLRGAGWRYFGLIPQRNWLYTMLLSLGVGLAVLTAVKTTINPIINALSNLGTQDLSRFEYLNGDLPNLIIMLVNIWITAAFLEEFLFRGYLMNRLVDLQGKQTKLTWIIAMVGQAVIFGLVHAYQSPVGMFKVGVIGLVFGLSFLAVNHNLWPLILAHGLIDSLDMVSHYFGR